VRPTWRRRANDLAEAGQRLYLKDTLLASSGSAPRSAREPRAARRYDTCRRLLDKGRSPGSALGDELRALQAPAAANPARSTSCSTSRPR
jgi:hypothetical protein